MAVLTVLPIWNDVWFPLILTTSADQQTLMLGVSRLFGQYTTDWTAILSILTHRRTPHLVAVRGAQPSVHPRPHVGAVKG